MKKYKITSEAHPENPSLHRIVALKDFSDVKKGDLGGYIEKEGNLSQEGTCWVCDSALVCDSVRVYGSALVYDSARVCGSALVCGPGTGIL